MSRLGWAAPQWDHKEGVGTASDGVWLIACELRRGAGATTIVLACEQKPGDDGGGSGSGSGRGSGSGTKGKEHTRLLPSRGACGAVELRCFSDERALLLRLNSYSQP